MTGPEHYREAERLLDIAGNDPHCPEGERERLEGRAQVHATLALAAATAMAGQGLGAEGRWHAGMNPVDFQAWDDVCGVEGE